MAVSIKDVRKGTRVTLRNGWEAEVMDNLTNRQTRMCKVFGDYVEVGSVYASDIAEAFVGGNWEVVNHSRNTLVLARNRKAWGF
jgi:hypothetical protein